jgi:hypothetical protein
VDFRRFPEPIVIEDEVWIGSNVVVLLAFESGSVQGRKSSAGRRRSCYFAR